MRLIKDIEKLDSARKLIYRHSSGMILSKDVDMNIDDIKIFLGYLGMGIIIFYFLCFMYWFDFYIFEKKCEIFSSVMK